jgi:hypothetical protein
LANGNQRAATHLYNAGNHGRTHLHQAPERSYETPERCRETRFDHMNIQTINNSFKQSGNPVAKGEVGLPAAIQAAQKRVASTKQQIAEIDKLLPRVRGAGSGKLVVAVWVLNDRITELDRQLAGLAKSAERLSKIL